MVLDFAAGRGGARPETPLSGAGDERIRRRAGSNTAIAGPDGRSRGIAPTGRVIRTRAGDDRLTDERGEWGIGSQEVGTWEDGENYRLPGVLSIPSFRFPLRLSSGGESACPRGPRREESSR